MLLASVPEGLAARALVALGIDAEALASAVADARRANRRSTLLPPLALLAECDEVRAEKEAAIEAQEFARAAELRERERELLKRALTAVEGRQDESLTELRRRLGFDGGVGQEVLGFFSVHTGTLPLLRASLSGTLLP